MQKRVDPLALASRAALSSQNARLRPRTHARTGSMSISLVALRPVGFFED